MSSLFHRLFGTPAEGGRVLPTPPPDGPRLVLDDPDAEPHGPERQALLDTLGAAIDALGYVGAPAEDTLRLRWLSEYVAAGEEDMAFYAAGLADGRNTHPHPEGRVQQTCVDPETYARIYNTGYADAEKHQTDAVVEVDLEPFTQVRTELGLRVRATGGGVQHAYMLSLDLLNTAFAQYERSE
jgi:hypothetical protein